MLSPVCPSPVCSSVFPPPRVSPPCVTPSCFLPPRVSSPCAPLPCVLFLCVFFPLCIFYCFISPVYIPALFVSLFCFFTTAESVASSRLSLPVSLYVSPGAPYADFVICILLLFVNFLNTCVYILLLSETKQKRKRMCNCWKITIYILENDSLLIQSQSWQNRRNVDRCHQGHF